MRYYDITILDPDDASEIEHWTSYNTETSTSNPYALNIEMDIPLGPMHDPVGKDSYVRIWGVPISKLSQASDYTYKNIVISGGFQNGLPLANSDQAGIIAKGMIYNSFGNWVGTDMTLDLYITAGSASSSDDIGGSGTNYTPKNIIFSCSKGDTFSSALENTFDTAFPNYAQDIDLDDTLVASEDINGHYHTLEQLSQYLNKKSKLIKSSEDTYPGVMLWIDLDTVYAHDWVSTDTSSYTQIEFKELIGQPTYGAPYGIQFMCPMRTDLTIGSVVEMPKTLYTTTSGALSGITSTSSQRDTSIFSGTFIVKQIRHVGNFRDPSGSAWMTVFDAIASTTNS